MNHPDFMPTAELRCISTATAEREGYQAITTRISPEREPDVFRSVQDGLRGIDAVWIETNGGFMAGRRKSELTEAVAGQGQ